MRKDKLIPVRIFASDHDLIKRVAKSRGFSDGRGDGVSALMRMWAGMLASLEKAGALDSLAYLAEKMGKGENEVLSGVLNARAKELLDKGK